MATITLDILPASALTRSVDAICGLNNYQTLINGSANPESRNAFAKRMLAKWLKEQIIEWETVPAVTSARATVTASVAALDIT